MKNTKHFIRIFAFVLLLSLSLSGCALIERTDSTEDLQKETELLINGYRDRIAELESTLQAQKQAQYISESDLKQKIAALETRVEQLLGVIENKKDEDVAAGASVFHYKVQNGGAVITGYEGNASLVQIPATLDGYPVTAIGERAFESKKITAVVLPESLERIEWFAFYQCSELIDMAIPAGVSEIGHAVFDGCNKLTLLCPAGSFALDYAKSYGIAYIIK